MCHKGTLQGRLRRPLRTIALMLALACLATAQSATWRRVGGSAVDLLLASPATGPVERVWFSGDGGVLYARTHSGKVFETADYEIWQPSVGAIEPAALMPPPTVFRIPEPGSRVVGGSFGRIYSLGRQLFRSEDRGQTWQNISAFKTDSVIGFGQHSVAISRDGSLDQIVVANDFGVWRSMDGGLSWVGLNQFLPNLAVKRILATPAGTAGTRVSVDGMGTMELPPGGTVWQPVSDPTLATEDAQLKLYAPRVAGEIRSYAIADKAVYVGMADGRILLSRDGGATFSPTDTGGAKGPVERIFVDPARPDVALAALGGPSLPHVLRTTNFGVFWDPLDANLPNVPVHAVTGERAAGAVYVATDKGVFWAKVDLDNPSITPANWVPLAGLPSAGAATDVHLDPAGIQLYTAIDGYGVYATAAPHRLRNVRLVNAADFSTRAAAPGSLMSVIGGRVNTARGANLNYPILAAADDASQIQVPFEAVGPNVVLALQTTTGTVRLGMQVQPVSPAIFVARDGAPMLQEADTGLLLDARKTAHAGSRVQVFATGLGKVTPDWPTGMPARVENPPVVAAAIRAFLNGAPVTVRSATLAGGYIGFYVVELELPTLNNAGPAELYITADGVESNRVQIVIEQ